MSVSVAEYIIIKKTYLLNLNAYNTVHFQILIKSMCTHDLQLWGNAKKFNLNIIQTVQNKILRSNANASPYISNFTIYSDLKIKTIYEEAKRTLNVFSTNCLLTMTL